MIRVLFIFLSFVIQPSAYAVVTTANFTGMWNGTGKAVKSIANIGAKTVNSTIECGFTPDNSAYSASAGQFTCTPNAFGQLSGSFQLTANNRQLRLSIDQSNWIDYVINDITSGYISYANKQKLGLDPNSIKIPFYKTESKAIAISSSTKKGVTAVKLGAGTEVFVLSGSLQAVEKNKTKRRSFKYTLAINFKKHTAPQ